MTARDNTSKSYAAWFLGTALALLVAAVGLSLFFKPLSGDLTRIGKWAERDFQPTLQSPISARPNGASFVHQQVLVLGDSFSHPNLWQSQVWESSRLETLSFHFKDVGCIDSWLSWVVRQESSGLRMVVVQVAERSFVPVFRNYRTCVYIAPVAMEVPDRKPEGLIAGITLDPLYLFRTATNSIRMRFQNGRLYSGDVVNIPLSKSEFFSNHLPNRLLYYAEDDNKKKWSQKDIDESVATLKRIQRRLGKLPFMVVVVPDKSTTYLPYTLGVQGKPVYPDILRAMRAAGIDTVDLLSLLQKKLSGNVDTYLPNDTHLGPSGYRLVGSAIAENIQHASRN